MGNMLNGETVAYPLEGAPLSEGVLEVPGVA